MKQKKRGGCLTAFIIFEVIVLLLLGTLGVFLFRRSRTDGRKEARKAGEALVQAFDEEDFEEITRLMFGSGSAETEKASDDGERADLAELPKEARSLLKEVEAEQAASGSAVPDFNVYACIQKKTSITLGEISKESMTFSVKAPDMQDVFREEKGGEADSAEEYIAFFEDYVDHADRKTSEIVIPYTFTDGAFSADFSNEDLVDAVTGGFLSAFSEAYGASIEMVRKEWGEK